MKFPNYKKIAEKLKKKDAVMANQCTCSNCNCRSANNMVNLSKLYKEKFTILQATKIMIKGSKEIKSGL